ncbi:MAG: HDOD domain-containing protein [Chitinivibrionales bacterium]|nr:HDOD domain-containing protein [Chitinivibrionales bacterium]
MEKSGKSNDILKKVSTITTIPTLPVVLEKITELLKNPQTSAEEIGKAISTDQALASKVLKLVNSAFYGFPGKISTITHAVVILGFATIKNIVLTASILELFKKEQPDQVQFNVEKFWYHSIACGAATKVLSVHMHCNQNEEYFIAGLIHDIGKIIFCQFLPKEFRQITEHVRMTNCLMFESEQLLFQTTHQDVGDIIARQWNLPSTLCSAIYCHHNPAPSQSHYLITALVHCADILVRAMDYGNGGDTKIPAIDSHVWNDLRLDNKNLLKLFDLIKEELDKATIFMQL